MPSISSSLIEGFILHIDFESSKPQSDVGESGTQITEWEVKSVDESSNVYVRLFFEEKINELKLEDQLIEEMLESLL